MELEKLERAPNLESAPGAKIINIGPDRIFDKLLENYGAKSLGYKQMYFLFSFLIYLDSIFFYMKSI